MSNQMITSTLLVDLSADEQQFVAGGFGWSKSYSRKKYGGGKEYGDCEKTDKYESPNGDCGGGSMYVGYKITVTPIYKCVDDETGKWHH
ncbi:hypothetical protein I8751_06870 [Nostocaceae cyanobacterium CENA357]|uniref:Uncharacterized protein n=1 Tax=Atlanticothrix silvestris CENA357 TaxID=1725252 RepID=A0A8J7KXV7_9CYAN|nr:hypothetical protein [Atlanticothrix silvestris]MBH8552095.1 hypothetical protein [Atlanticothrix silvestris CENA357]